MAAAQRAIGFFKDVLCLNGGQFEGVPFELDPSQAFRIGSLFGWKRADGTRRFHRFYDEEGKGNGKSPMLAGIGLYCMVADGEARAEIYAAGSKKDQAMVLFRDAVAMVDQSPHLAVRLKKSGGTPVWNIADFKTGSFFRPISSDDGQSGPRPSCALCDEVHEHRDGTVIELLERGFKWRRQPLLVMATNSGTDRNSVCWQEHLHAVRCAAGTATPDQDFTYVGEVIDDAAFAYVCALDKDDDPLEDPSCWVKANPLLGVTVKTGYLAQVVKQAKQIPGKLNGILRLHFCVWTDSDQAWMSHATIEKVLHNFDPAAEHVGKDIWIGIDLSGSQDLTAEANVVQTGTRQVERKDEKTGASVVLELPTYDAWVTAWTPADTMSARALRDQTPYDVWAEKGDLIAIPGSIIRMDFVAAHILGLSAEFVIKAIAYDRYAYRRLEEEFAAGGFTAPQFEHPQGGTRRARATPEQIEEARLNGEEPPQGLWMPGSLAALELLILEQRIRIRSSPVVVAAIMGAAIETDAFDNRWFSKRKATVRIDALIALVMAVGLATAAPPSEEDIYKGRGLLVFG